MCYAFLRDTGTGRPCSACGTDNPSHASFCRHCGTQLDATAPPPLRRAELVQAVLDGVGGGLVGGAEEEFVGAPGESSEFDVVGPIGPIEPAAPPTAATEAPPPAAPAPPPSQAAVVEEEELAPPTVPADFELDLSAPPPPPPPGPEAPVAPEQAEAPAPPPPPPPEEFELDLAPPPPPPGIEDLAPEEAAPPAPPAEEPSEPAQAPPPPPGTLEILEDEDEFGGWELDFGDADGEKKD